MAPVLPALTMTMKILSLMNHTLGDTIIIGKPLSVQYTLQNDRPTPAAFLKSNSPFEGNTLRYKPITGTSKGSLGVDRVVLTAVSPPNEQESWAQIPAGGKTEHTLTLPHWSPSRFDYAGDLYVFETKFDLLTYGGPIAGLSDHDIHGLKERSFKMPLYAFSQVVNAVPEPPTLHQYLSSHLIFAFILTNTGEDYDGRKNCIVAEQPVEARISLQNNSNHSVSVAFLKNPFDPDGETLFTNQMYSRQDLTSGEILKLGNDVPVDPFFYQPERRQFRELGAYMTWERNITLAHPYGGKPGRWYEMMWTGDDYIFKAKEFYTVYNGSLKEFAEDKRPQTTEIKFQIESQVVHAVKEIKSKSRRKARSLGQVSPSSSNLVSEIIHSVGANPAHDLSTVTKAVQVLDDILTHSTEFNSTGHPNANMKQDTRLEDLFDSDNKELHQRNSQQG